MENRVSDVLKSGTPQDVPVEYIVPAERNPYAKGDTEEEIYNLAMSIQINGLIYPLLLNKITDTEYRIIAGEKRYKAITRYLHWDTIPSTVHEHLSPNAAQLMLHAANLDVREYTSGQKLQFYIDAEQLLCDMKDSGEYTGAIQKGISEMLGISTHQVRKYKRIVEALSDKQLQKVMDGNISIERAYKLAQSASVEKPDAAEEPESGRTSAFTEKPDAMKELKSGRTSAFTEKPDAMEELKSGRTSAFAEKPDAIEEPDPGRTSAFKDPGSYKETVSMLRMLPFAPGDICAVLEGDQVRDGIIDRIELYECALVLSVMVNNVRKSYPVSKIGVNIYIGEGCFDTAERAVKAS
nr:ParB/RepB/Spo0J family partition protein [Caproiciproducens faecalis]